jgi:Concanavalin A-like lectin/glucanases superfamily
MLGYTSASRPLVLLGFLAACSPRTLTLVEFHSDGGHRPASIDGNPGNPSDTATSATLLRGLVGLWHLDDAVGSTLARDSSGNGNDGTLVGLDPAQAWVTGRQGGALATNGAGYVSVPDSPSIDGITTQVTVSAWVYFDGVISAADSYGTAISRQVGTTNEQYYHLSLYQTGTPTLFIGFSASVLPVRPAAPQPVVAKQWTHLAGTYDGSLATLYVDGVEANSLPISGVFPLDTRPVILGGNGNAGAVTELFPGRIDEVALYNRALTPEEVQLLATPVAF